MVTSREGRVSRNNMLRLAMPQHPVTSREGRVSRNFVLVNVFIKYTVTSREGRVSRNNVETAEPFNLEGHVP